MSTFGTLYTERQVRERERAAFLEGLIVGDESNCYSYDPSEIGEKGIAWGKQAMAYGETEEWEYLAAERYPTPTVARPRIVTDDIGNGPYEWRVVDGAVEWRPASLSEGRWLKLSSAGGMYITQERVVMLADLLANPDETVDAE